MAFKANYSAATKAVQHTSQFFFDLWPHWVTQLDIDRNSITGKQVTLRDDPDTEGNQGFTQWIAKPGLLLGQSIENLLPHGGKYFARDIDSATYVQVSMTYAAVPNINSYVASSYSYDDFSRMVNDLDRYSQAVDDWYAGIGTASARQAVLGDSSGVLGTWTTTESKPAEYFRHLEFQLDDEHLIGSAFGDTLEGGQGADRIEGLKGNDTIDGGTSETDGDVDVDVAVFNGPRWRYELRDTPGADVTTTVKNLPGGGGYGTDTIVRIEKLEFTGGYEGKAVSGNVYVEMAYFAKESYIDASASGDYRGWTSLNALDLGLAHTGAGWSLLNGTFVTQGTAEVGEAAAAKAYLAEFNGKKTVMLAFRGTDFDEGMLNFLDDASYWPRARQYYALFEPYLEALDDFVSAHGISQVMVTGHSLGAAMVQYFMADHSGGKYIAGTFGNYGTHQNNLADSRILNFMHQEDPVSSHLKAGARVVIPLNELDTQFPESAEFDDGLGLYEHGMSQYLASVRKLALLGHVETAFIDLTSHNPGSIRTIAAGDAQSNSFGGDDGKDTDDILLGGGKVDYIRGFEGDDHIYGGTNWDYLYGDEGDDVISGNEQTDTLYGGAGRDSLYGSDAWQENDNARDYFVYTAMKDSGLSADKRDTIFGFFEGSGSDRIDLSRLATGGPSDQFAFIGTAGFGTNTPGQVRVVQDGLGWMVSVNTDTDRNAEMTIFVVSPTAPGIEDFML